MKNLNIDISYFDISEGYLARAAQMTARTNQFNVYKQIRSENQFRELMVKPSFEGLVGEVKDRFGNYGISVLVTYKITDDVLHVDSLLLSCRVLGRGVEHALLSKIGTLALSKKIELVRIPIKPSEKNMPALSFLNTLLKEDANATFSNNVYLFNAEYLKELTFESISEVDEELEFVENVGGTHSFKVANYGQENSFEYYLQELFSNIAGLPLSQISIDSQYCLLYTSD